MSTTSSLWNISHVRIGTRSVKRSGPTCNTLSLTACPTSFFPLEKSGYTPYLRGLATHSSFPKTRQSYTLAAPVPSVKVCCPSAVSGHARHPVWLGPSLYSFSLHALHCSERELLENVPAAHAKHAVCRKYGLKKPAEQFVHGAFAAATPFSTPKVPGGHKASQSLLLVDASKG
eukprot:1159356-Rhodomonas_salina.1